MNLDKNIKNGESYHDYMIRISENKDLYGLSWEEIARLLNSISGNSYSESFYRKRWKKYKNTKNIKKNTIEDLDYKKIELEKERIKFYDQRRAYKKIIREEARRDSLVEIVQKAASEIVPMNYSHNGIIKKSSNDLIVGLNDIHYGILIDNYWNKYSPEIAKQRFERYLNSILNIKYTHNSSNCYVCANGDFISGNIHKTIEVSNCENVVEQVMNVAELISWFLKNLCENFNNVYLSVVSGNHSRISDKDKSQKDERLDNLIPWYIKARLQNIPNLSIIDNTIDNTFNIVNIRGLNYLNVHGDYDGVGTIQKLTSMIDDEIYCVHFGHKHHNYSDYVNGCKIIMSGSMMGMDDFCIEKRIYGIAQQMVCVCSDSGILCMYDVNLQ